MTSKKTSDKSRVNPEDVRITLLPTPTKTQCTVHFCVCRPGHFFKCWSQTRTRIYHTSITYDGHNCTQEMQNLILEHVKWDSIPPDTGFAIILYSCISFFGWPICWVGDVTWVLVSMIVASDNPTKRIQIKFVNLSQIKSPRVKSLMSCLLISHSWNHTISFPAHTELLRTWIHSYFDYVEMLTK